MLPWREGEKERKETGLGKLLTEKIERARRDYWKCELSDSHGCEI
jgi:hypothetical protein